MSGKSIVVDSKMYTNNMECIWEFSTQRGFYLVVNFPARFFIEASPNCSKDYLELQHFAAGLWLSDARLCGREVTQTFTVSSLGSQKLRAILRTDGAVTGDGFVMQVTPTCNVTFNVTAATQTILSPEFKIMGIHRLHCVYSLIAKADQRISVRIKELNYLIASKSCDYYSITAYKRSLDTDDTQQLLEAGKYCGSAEIRSRSFLQLHLAAVIERNVRIEFELEMCGGTIDKPTIISSLRSDNSDDDHYINGMNCIWNISAPPDHSIIVHFKYFDMESSDECRYDYLAIYAGALIAAEKRITALCGNLTARAPLIVVDSNQAVLSAASDASVSHRGFLAELFFTRNCNERIALSEGNTPLTLVRHLAVNMTDMLMCHYRIMAPQGYRISVELKDLKFGCALNSCTNCNYMELLDSVQAQRVSLGKYCQSRNGAVKLLSSFEDMLIKISATKPGQHSFELVLHMEESVCGGRNELKLDMDAISVRFPLHNDVMYPANVHCRWYIRSDTAFQMHFEMLAMQNVSQLTGKCLDYLHIKSNYISQYFCGNATGFNVLIPNSFDSHAEITFHSDDAIEGKGFHLTVKHLRDCNRTYTTSSGLITYTRGGGQNVVCYDIIRLSAEYTLTLFEYGFNSYADEYDCDKYYLKIFDLIGNKTLKKICRFAFDTTNLVTSTNAVRLEYATAEMRLFYVAAKKPAPAGCGGEISTHEGVLENPPYDTDRNQSDCRWDIIMPAPSRIRLMFYSFDMGSSINCPLDYVRVVEVNADKSRERVAQTYCGQSIPRDYISHSNHIALISKKSLNFDGYGWRIRFETYEDPSDWTSDKYVDVFS